jgi:hypothetical protein
VEQWEEEEGMENTLFKSNSIQDSPGNEENGYPVPDPNKTMINVINEPCDDHKNAQKRNPVRNH